MKSENPIHEPPPWKARALFAEGHLKDALASIADELRAHPTDVDRRGFLAVLLAFDGQLERADQQLDVLARQNASIQPAIALFRQLVRAETWRQDFHTQGRPPELLTRPDERTRLHLEASMLLREGRAAEAALQLARAEELRPRVHGILNREAFDDLRDCDDLLGGYLEVLTRTGDYYWVPLDLVEAATFHPPERTRDLLWRRVSMKTRSGPEGDVFVPAVYATPDAMASEGARLGRETDWIGGDGSPVRGIGLRTFLAGDRALTVHDLEVLVPETDLVRASR